MAKLSLQSDYRHIARLLIYRNPAHLHQPPRREGQVGLSEIQSTRHAVAVTYDFFEIRFHDDKGNTGEPSAAGKHIIAGKFAAVWFALTQQSYTVEFGWTTRK